MTNARSSSRGVVEPRRAAPRRAALNFTRTEMNCAALRCAELQLNCNALHFS